MQDKRFDAFNKQQEEKHRASPLFPPSKRQLTKQRKLACAVRIPLLKLLLAAAFHSSLVINR